MTNDHARQIFFDFQRLSGEFPPGGGTGVTKSRKRRRAGEVLLAAVDLATASTGGDDSSCGLLGTRTVKPLSRVVFSRDSDEWSTPQELFDRLDAEFQFILDAAAMANNAKVEAYLGPDSDIPGWQDAMRVRWAFHTSGGTIWLNPPYSRCREFIAKAAHEAQEGCTVVCLVPARVDTRWWFDHVWDGLTQRPRPGVEVRFIKGRLKFGNSENSAPFPSVIVVFRPPGEAS